MVAPANRNFDGSGKAGGHRERLGIRGGVGGGGGKSRFVGTNKRGLEEFVVFFFSFFIVRSYATPRNAHTCEEAKSKGLLLRKIAARRAGVLMKLSICCQNSY